MLRLRTLTACAVLAFGAGCTLDDGSDALAFVSITPNVGTLAGGTAVQVAGRGFDADTTIAFRFDDSAITPGKIVDVALAAPTLVSSRLLLSTTPIPPTGFIDVKQDVVMLRGSSTVIAIQAYTYQSLPPTVSTVAPNSGPTSGGTVVVVTGTGFLGGAGVTFNGTAATSVTFDSPNQLTVTTPPGGAGVATVRVTNPDSQFGELSGGFTFVGPPVPTATLPSGGPTVGGTRLTITGTGFQTGATVAFIQTTPVSVNALASDVIVSVSSIICTVPQVVGAGGSLPLSVNVQVTNPDTQNGTLNGGFTYRASRLFVAHSASPNTLMVLNVTPATVPLQPTIATAFGTPTSTGGNTNPTLAHYADGTFPNGILYVGHGGSDSIDTYTVSSTGTLTQLGSTLAMTVPGGVTALQPALMRIHSPSIGVLVLYVLNSAGWISRFNINTSTGAITEASGSPVDIAPSATGTAGPTDWIISGATMYVADAGRDLIAVLTVATDGTLAPHTGAPAGIATGASTAPAVLHLFPGGQFLYASQTGTSGNNLAGFSVAPSPPLSSISGGPFATGTFPLGIADDGASLFVANSGSNTVSPFTVSTLNGTLTTGTTAAAGTGPALLQVRTPHLYALNLGSNDVSGWTIGVVGALTSLGSATSTGLTSVSTWQWGADTVFALDPSNVNSLVRTVATGVLGAGTVVGTGGTTGADLLLGR